MSSRTMLQPDYITLDDVAKLRDKLPPGAPVLFRETVAYREDSCGQAHRRHRMTRGRVIRRYPHLIEVRRKDGSRTTVTYIELLMTRRRLQRKTRPDER